MERIQIVVIFQSFSGIALTYVNLYHFLNDKKYEQIELTSEFWLFIAAIISITIFFVSILSLFLNKLYKFILFMLIIPLLILCRIGLIVAGLFIIFHSILNIFMLIVWCIYIILLFVDLYRFYILINYTKSSSKNESTTFDDISIECTDENDDANELSSIDYN